MKNNSNASTETQQIVRAIRAGESTESLRAKYISQHIREIRNEYGLINKKWYTTGTEVFDILQNYKNVRIEAEAKKSTYDFSTQFYLISVDGLQLRLGISPQQNKDKRCAVELYYGSCYIFNAIFIPPEFLADTILEAAEQYPKWQRSWDRMILKCQKQARLQSIGSMAIGSYLRQKTQGLALAYYISEQRTEMCICFRLIGGFKYKITVPLVGFQQQIDQAIEQVVNANNALAQLLVDGKIVHTQSTDEWILSDLEV